MNIQFPPCYSLLQKEAKEIAQTGFPYFDLLWLKSESNSPDLKELPLEIL